MRKVAKGALTVSAALLLSLAAACSSSGNGNGGGGGATGPSTNGGSSKGGKIALLLPETKTTRYEQFDKPLFEAEVKAKCPTCEVIYQNANQDAATQQNQADQALTNGAQVLVLDAVDGKAAASIVNKAKAQNVPVIAYDRLANGPVDFYVSYDNVKVGELQGEALIKALSAGGDPKRGDIVMINGSPTDPNAADFKKGAHQALDGKVNIGKEYDTPDWSPDKAQNEMQGAITALGKDKIIGVYSANDGMAAGIVAALHSAGFNPIPPVTGQDAQLDGIQRIISGQQYMTVFKAFKPEADAAADAAVAFLNGQKPQTTTTLTNGSGDQVPSQLLVPVAVTKDNVKSAIVDAGLYTVDQICTAQYADACKAAGLQ